MKLNISFTYPSAKLSILSLWTNRNHDCFIQITLCLLQILLIESIIRLAVSFKSDVECKF